MRELLEAPLDDLERRVFRDALSEIESLYEAAGAEALRGVSRHFRAALRSGVEQVERLLVVLRRAVEERKRVETGYDAFMQRLAAATDEEQRQALMLEFLSLFTPASRLAGDRKAFSRHMGLDCVQERYHRWRTNRWLREELLVRASGRRTADITRAVFEHDHEIGDEPLKRIERLFLDLHLEQTLLEQVRVRSRWRNQRAALRAVSELADSLPFEHRQRLLRRSTAVVIRCALDQRLSVWVQREAINLVPKLVRPDEAERILTQRLFDMDPHAGDDLFVRSEAVRVVATRIGTPRQRVEWLRRVLERPDPSEHVRVETVAALAGIERVEADRVLLAKALGTERQRDESDRVRARCLEGLCERALRSPEREPVAAGALAHAMTEEASALVRRVAMEEAVRLAHARRHRLQKFKIDDLDHTLLVALDTVIRREPDVALKRFAARARDEIITVNDAAHAWFQSRLARELDVLEEGKALSVPLDQLACPPDTLGRLLALHARKGLGYMVEFKRRRARFLKGDRFRLRLWRVLHEIRHPDTAKRQAHRHTTGRVMYGELRCPPDLVAELIETKVPGERLWIGTEQTWRRFLPLVDDFMSMFSWRPWRRLRRVRIHSSEGMTEIIDRRSWWRAAWAHLRMSWNYARLARLRNAHPEHPVVRDRSLYLKAIHERYGLETLFYPAGYRYEGRFYPLEDPSVADHFRFAASMQTLREAKRNAVEDRALSSTPFSHTETAAAPAVREDEDDTEQEREAERDPCGDERETEASLLDPGAVVERLLAPLMVSYDRMAAEPIAEEDDAPHVDLATNNTEVSTLDPSALEPGERTATLGSSLSAASLDETQPAVAFGAPADVGDALESVADTAEQDTLDDTAGDQTPLASASALDETADQTTAPSPGAALEETADAPPPTPDEETADLSQELEETAGDETPLASASALDETADETIAPSPGAALEETADAPPPAPDEETADLAPELDEAADGPMELQRSPEQP